ncbi:TPA: hypothetical protein QDB21_005612 [Burkholderia vietnamiensis]|nr:hypothetical protein [Burkholderia vietnamiensis]
MKPAYVLHPGPITSATDGDSHYIDASALVRLYGLRDGEYVIYEPPRAFDRARSWRRDPYEGMTHLFPRADGNYSLQVAA